MRTGGRGGAIRRAVAVAVLALGIVAGGAVGPATAYDEGTIVSLVDQARWAQGLNGLVENPALDAVALAWAQQLAVNGTLSHNPAVGQQIPGGWTAWGENVAQGYATGAAVHDGWMNSPGHRANILGGFTDIGVALIQGGGTTWAVEVFAAYPGSGGAPPPAAAPAPAPDTPVAESPAATAPPETATPTPTPTPTATATPTPVAAAAEPAPSASSTPAAIAAAAPAATPTAAPAESAAAIHADMARAAVTPWGRWGTGVGAALVGTMLFALPATRRSMGGRKENR